MEDQYILKNRYPSLPDSWNKGTKVEKVRLPGFRGRAYKNKEDSGQTLPVEEVENSPEFWEKVEPRKYEITQLLSNKGPETNVILDYEGDKCVKRSDGSDPSFTIKKSWLIDFDDIEIHQVKRRRDNLKFTIGDRVTYFHNNEPVDPWVIDHFTEDGDKSVTAEAKGEQYCDINACSFRHAPKEYVFTTEDGKDIFIGDSYWMIRPRKQEVTKYEKADKHSGVNSDLGYRYFSTKEEAQRNLKQYSKADIKEAIKCATKRARSIDCFIETIKYQLDI